MGYSAQVELNLHIEGQVIPLAQCGGDFVILRGACLVGMHVAELEVTVDGRKRLETILVGRHSIDDGTKAIYSRVAKS